MTITFEDEIAWRMTCSVCGRQVGENYRLAVNCAIPYPTLPDGWRALDGKLVCDKHEIYIHQRGAAGAGAAEAVAASVAKCVATLRFGFELPNTDDDKEVEIP